MTLKNTRKKLREVAIRWYVQNIERTKEDIELSVLMKKRVRLEIEHLEKIIRFSDEKFYQKMIEDLKKAIKEPN